MPELAEILAELAGSNLPDRTRQQVFIAWTLVVVARAEAESPEEIVRAVEDLVAGPSRAAAGAQSHLIDALTAIGAARCRDAQVHSAVARALRELAIHARANGDRVLGHDALNASVDIDIVRLVGLLPDQRHPCLTRTGTENPDSLDDSETHPAPARKTYFRRPHPPVYHDAAPVDASPQAADAATPVSRDQAGAAFDLICDSIAHLSAMLAGPRPGNSWPGGWQGVGALDRDVERIGRLALSLYQHHRYPTGVVEEALETAAIQLLAEDRQASKLPTDRTGWRLAHTPAPAGPAVTVAKTLAELMVAAFAAGFDRRALLTGRRLLAAATVAVQEGDTAAAEGYASALDKALNKITSQVDNELIAYRRRESLLIAGLIAEFPPLLEAMDAAADRARSDAVSDVIHHLPWRTYSNPWILASIAWRARLAAVGWPVSVPGVSRVNWFAPAPEPKPWRTSLLDLAESELRSHLIVKDPIYAAALLISLWANAVVAIQDSELTVRTRLRDLLREALQDYDKAYAQRPAQHLAGDGDDEAPGVRPFDPQLRRLINAAIRWTLRDDPTAPARIPPSRDHRNLRHKIQQLLDTPEASDWHYHGLITTDDTKLVVVEECDGSRRLLRDSEAGAHGLFAWGYGGSGPHTFADLLANDILADLIRCPHCLGAAPCGIALVTCSPCRGTGRIRGRTTIAELLVERVISQLPHQAGKPSPLPDAVWKVSRNELLARVFQ